MSSQKMAWAVLKIELLMTATSLLLATVERRSVRAEGMKPLTRESKLRSCDCPKGDGNDQHGSDVKVFTNVIDNLST